MLYIPKSWYNFHKCVCLLLNFSTSWKSSVKEQWPERVQYMWVPEIMTVGWVRKGHKKLNMFSVFVEQIKKSKTKFWNQLHPKTAFLCQLLTQKATWRQNHKTLRLSGTAIPKDMTDTFFLGPSQNFVIYVGRFFQRVRVLWDWLAGHSHQTFQKSIFLCNQNFCWKSFAETK